MTSNYRLDSCSKCENQRYLVNRTLKLCNNCNCHRLHGVSLIDYARQKKSKQIERQREKAKSQPPKQRIAYFSKKGRVTHDRLSAVKSEIRKEAYQSDTYYCQGCGTAGEGLDCSHIISVAQRSDLQFDRENINLFCRSCHILWESGDIVKMLFLHSFKKDMEYIIKNDSVRSQKLLDKLSLL